jgi:hypothetical protein
MTLCPSPSTDALTLATLFGIPSPAVGRELNCLTTALPGGDGAIGNGGIYASQQKTYWRVSRHGGRHADLQADRIAIDQGRERGILCIQYQNGWRLRGYRAPYQK